METELKKLADLWKEQRFNLHKYTNVSKPPRPHMPSCRLCGLTKSIQACQLSMGLTGQPPTHRCTFVVTEWHGPRLGAEGCG